MGTEASFLTELGKSGPWALVAGFLLWMVIKAWNQDRAQVTQLMGSFQQSIDKLTTEIHGLVSAVTEQIKEDQKARR